MVVERTASFGKLHLKGIVASVGLTAGLLVLIFPLPELESPARIQLALTLGALSFWASGVIIAGRLPRRSTLSCHTVPRRAASC